MGDGSKKSTKITVKPLPGEKRKDGKPKTAADKRREAMEFCLALERAENSAKAGTLTEQTAKRLIAEIVERTSGDKLHDHTAAEWLNEWCAGKAETKSAATAERYAQVTREFLASLGGRARLSLGHITPKDIRSYRDAELSAGKSPKTANMSVKCVSTAFNAALRQGYITNNPCTALESLPEATAEQFTNRAARAWLDEVVRVSDSTFVRNFQFPGANDPGIAPCKDGGNSKPTERNTP